MKKILYSIIVITIVITGNYLKDIIKDYDIIEDQNIEITNDFNYLPTSSTQQIVNHKYYSLSYNEENEQPEWVAYELKASHVIKNNLKRPYFQLDDKVKTKSAHWKNYKKSGYDKGHYCPAADRSLNKEAYNETFLTSNISPQKHSFNAGIWNSLEQRIRYWVKQEKQLYIITGPIFKNKNSVIGFEKLPVPTHFYKIILKNHKTNPKSVAFLIPHNTKDKDYSNFSISIDELEKMLNIDFFPAMEDNIEDHLERKINTEFNL